MDLAVAMYLAMYPCEGTVPSSDDVVEDYGCGSGYPNGYGNGAGRGAGRGQGYGFSHDIDHSMLI